MIYGVSSFCLNRLLAILWKLPLINTMACETPQTFRMIMSLLSIITHIQRRVVGRLHFPTSVISKMMNEYTIIDHRNQCFIGPCEQHSVIFDVLMTSFLKAVKTIDPKCLISGSSALLETQIFQNNNNDDDDDDRLFPNDIDVFINLDTLYYPMHGLGSMVEKFFRELFQEGCKHDVTYFDRATSIADKNSKYRIDYGDYYTLGATAKVKVQEIGGNPRRHPIPVQFIFVVSTFIGGSWVAQGFEEAVLDAFDINICKCTYTLEDRTISFPTDVTVFQYVLQRLFYVKQSRNKPMELRRVLKYQSRGFRLCGYWSEDETVAHVLSTNELMYTNKEALHDMFLQNVEQPEDRSQRIPDDDSE